MINLVKWFAVPTKCHHNFTKWNWAFHMTQASHHEHNFYAQIDKNLNTVEQKYKTNKEKTSTSYE